MSQAAPPVQVKAKIAEALGLVAFLPAAVQGALRTLLYDLLSHHRLSLLKRGGEAFPGRREAQKFLATRLWRYTRATGGDRAVAELVGESFAAARSGQTFGGASLRQLEEGGAVTAREAMVVPAGRGAQMTREKLLELLRSKRGDVDLIVRPGRPPVLVRDLAPSGRKHRKGLRTELLAVLTRRRTQRRLLGFFEEFERVQAKDLPKWESALDMLETATGQARLVEREESRRTGGLAYVAAYREFIAANPGRNAEAMKVAKRAAAEARRRLRS